MGIVKATQAEDFEPSESRFDWRLALAILSIMLIGLINVYSATVAKGGAEGGPDMFFRQVIFICMGLGLMASLLLFDYRLIERLSYFLYGLNLLALLSTPFLGVLRSGARRWLNLGFINYQPSETMKLMTILALARYFQNKSSMNKMGFRELFAPLTIVGVPTLLTMAQPDLGTGGHILMIGGIMLLFVGIRPRVLWTLALAAVVTFPIAWQSALKPYQKERIRIFLDPMQDPKGHGYNAIQSMIAVGSGEVFGKGFQKGTQTQLDFTPEGHTDFIFTVLAEEWGIIGGLALLGAYLFMLARCVAIASMARDKFGSLVCVGVIGMITSQVFINIAMVCGMFPIVGIPLPLVSYGGTSIFNVCVALGVLLNIGYKRSIF